jgi:CRP/FNR family transcriptional regulator
MSQKILLLRGLWAACFPELIRQMDNGIRLLMESANLVKLPAKQQLFYPGSVCENYLLVIDGIVNVQILSESGREILLYQVRSGDSCVLTTSCLLSGDRYPAEGIAESEVTAFAISSPAFYRCIDQSAYFREFVFKNFSSRLSNLIGRMESVVFETIDQRICRILIDKGYNIITTTHHELAYELSTVREVVSRHLKKYESYGWISLKRGTIDIINRDALIDVYHKR